MGLEHAGLSEKTERVDRDEQAFLQGIEQLRREGAGQLAIGWENKYDALLDERAEDAAVKKFFVQFSEFQKKREDALFSLEIPDDLDETLTAEMRGFDKDIVMSFGNATLFQGNGGTAEVYEVLGHPKICAKFITNQARYNENNHLRTEFALMKAVRELHYGHVRTPKPYFLRIHSRDGHSFAMEKVDGKNLSQIIERPAECAEFVALAKKLDREQVLAELTQFVGLVHEKGITHNDLFQRNIMLDRGGNLFVIDFGKGKKDETEALHHMHRESDLAQLNSEIRSFFTKIDKIEI